MVERKYVDINIYILVRGASGVWGEG